jgi:hypothetical protein
MASDFLNNAGSLKLGNLDPWMYCSDLKTAKVYVDFAKAFVFAKCNCLFTLDFQR